MQRSSRLTKLAYAITVILVPLLAAPTSYAESYDRKWKNTQLWQRHKDNSSKYFDKRQDRDFSNRGQHDKYQPRQYKDRRVNVEKYSGPRHNYQEYNAKRHQPSPNLSYNQIKARPKYNVYNRHGHVYNRTPWYNTFYLAPIGYSYRPYGYRSRHLPHSHVRIVIRSVPYYYSFGTYYTFLDNEYVVVRAPLGAYVESLPDGFIAFTLGLSTYFFVNDTYYTWDESRERYAVIEKPAGADNAIKSATTGRLFAYPNSGQSEEQQAEDRYNCHQWAVSETNVDPASENFELSSTTSSNYKRAISACLAAKNYTVK